MNLKSLLSAAILTLTTAGAVSAQCQAGFTATVNGTAVTFTNTSTGAVGTTFWYWNFGDNTTGWQMNPTHSYNNVGYYTVCLTMIDSSMFNTCQSTFCDTVYMPYGCNLSVTPNVTNASSCSSCDGGATLTVTGGPGPYTYNWYNSNTSSSMTNACPGSYYVTVTDTLGCTASTNVNIGCPPNSNCQAGFTYTVNNGTVTFSNTSTNQNNFYTNFFWSYGDNTTGYGINPGPHTYTANGTYVVCLTLNDSLAQCSSTFCDTITISNATSGCSSSFFIIRDSVNTLLGYAFPTVTGTAPFTYLWDFGDNTSSTQQYPSHTYAVAGSYVICLTVVDANACTTTYCDSSSFYRMSSANIIQFLQVMGGPQGVEEHNQLLSKVWPNPATDQLNISLNRDVRGVLRLTDLLGNTVYTANVNGNTFRFDTGAFAEGSYMLHLQTETGSLNERVIIIRK